jgi:hypothetical protein
MSKRLSDTEVWKKSWFFDLPDKYKLFWYYILSDCDAAGIWTANFKIAKAYLGEIDIEKVIEYFKGQITILNGGSYWLINDFIRFQYGFPIKDTAPMFKKIDSLLSQRNLSLDTLYDTVSKINDTVYNTVKDIDKDKVIVKDKEIIYPFDSENFKQIWEHWKTYKKEQHKFIYKTAMTEQAALKHLGELSGQDELSALLIIQQSIANGWKGFFELKNQPHGQGQTTGDHRRSGSRISQTDRERIVGDLHSSLHQGTD